MALQLVKKLRCFGFGLPDETEDKKKKKWFDPCPYSEKMSVVCSDMDNLSLGVKVFGEKMRVFIPRNTKIPRKEEQFLYTTHDFQSRMAIDVYEGESSLAMENIWLGGIKLTELVPAPKGVTKFKVCFDFDVNGTLKVSAQDMITSEFKEITITNYKRQSTKILNAMYSFKDYTYGVMQTIYDARYEGKLKVGEKDQILKVCNKAIEWLNENPPTKVYEFKEKQKELEVLWNPIITRICNDAAGQSTPKVAPEFVHHQRCHSCP